VNFPSKLLLSAFIFVPGLLPAVEWDGGGTGNDFNDAANWETSTSFAFFGFVPFDEDLTPGLGNGGFIVLKWSQEPEPEVC
jgi:hypothetical protein